MRNFSPLSPQFAHVMLLALMIFGGGLTPSFGDADDAVASKHFSAAVLPLLKKHCYPCHSHDADEVEGGLVLDSRAGWVAGGDSGAAIAAGKPESSLLLKAVNYSSADLQMPPGGKLSQSDVDTLTKWIADGAFDPRVPKNHGSSGGGEVRAASETLWSLRPVEPVDVPNVRDFKWCRNDVDHFILASLAKRGITPNPAADKYSLLRRASFDLIGLPPTLDEIEAFIHDDRQDAYPRLIDRLLDSPHYGERWGRHWLDLARYGDSNGGDINYAQANAWRYRDYVVASFNNDKPYSTFIREQLAGDLLPDDGDPKRRQELLTATGFLMLGPKMLAEVDTDKLLIDIVDEQLDVAGMTFLGLTLGCARCHDHKFDPISTEDYYAMAGIFRSTKVIDVLRPSNGVSEWLEIDVTAEDVRAKINELKSEQQVLQQRLTDLGAANSDHNSKNNAATRAIVTSPLQPIQSTTWSAWSRIDTPQTLGAVVSASYDGASQGHSLGFDRGNTPRVVWNHGGGAHTIIAASKPVSLGQWHHLVVSFDATEQRLQLYVDGHVAASASHVSTTDFKTVSVGRREASQQFQLFGEVDEVAVYDLALSDTQIQDLFDKLAPDVSPLFHWSFDQIQDASVVDSGPNDVRGRIVGVSPNAQRVKDGVVGRAFSFNVVKDGEAKPDVERTRQVTEIRERLREIDATIPRASRVMGVAAADPVDLAIHVRGSHLNLSDQIVARTTPKVFDPLLDPVQVPSGENGRLQLADWITHPNNPLTARVIVNRVWQHHFGKGLVSTPSNFGTRGERPSHPQLLDWLAGQFIDSGWSIKQMHRLIMNSATYRMSSRRNDASARQDPDNRLLGAFPVRRLEAEAIRDSLFAVSDELDKTIGGTLFTAPNKKRVTMEPVDPIYASSRRSIYLPSVRVRSYEMFSVFDVSDNGQHVDRRPQTMVAGQALFLTNNRLVMDRATSLAQRIKNRPGDAEDHIDWLHHILYGRPAGQHEISNLVNALGQLTQLDAESDAGESVFAWQHLIHTMICANEFIHVR